ncbi:hypothetical protein [Nocardioides sp. SYSU D00065]|uniref:hypothetical protein n=1 Tax=Nocardioides sp. SYSU D00065 TaxID=2817378 RepID=UPI001B31DA7F|nr:hypothetical protein [Nocardioides sp. SYSU D00065]
MTPSRRAGRLRELVGGRLGDRVGDRLAGITGSEELDALDAAVGSLEVAVRENRALEVPLAVLVDGLERDVAEVLSRRADAGMGA